MAAATVERGACTSDGFLRALKSVDDPAEIEKHLLLLLHSLSSPTEDAIFLSPASLCYLLHLLVEHTEDAWLEVRRKIAFVFCELVSKGNGDVLADALIYGRLQRTTNGEARAGHIDFSASVDGEGDADVCAAPRKLGYFLRELAAAHGLVERCVPAADVFRSFMRVPSFLRIILSTADFASAAADERKSAQQPQVVSEQFQESCIGILCRSLTSYTTVLCTETWRSLITALNTNKGLAASVLLDYFNDFMAIFLDCLSSRNFVAKLHTLELLAAVLGDPDFQRARRKYAESPALLCALLSLTNNPSAHIRFLTFDALKVFIAKGNQPAPIRYILYINRDMLARYVDEYSTKANAINDRLEIEKQKLLHSLISLEPLTHEEELLLGI